MSQELQTLIADLVASSPGGAPPHPEPAQLLAYRACRLDEEAAEVVREHLVACRACAAALVDLDAFEGRTPLDPEAVEEPLDYAAAAAWRALAPQLAAQEAAPSSQPQSPASPWWNAWGSRLAAVLAIAVLGLGIWGAQLSLSRQALERELAESTAPQANLPVVYLDALTRSESAPMLLAATGERRAFFLTPPLTATAQRFAVRFEHADGATVAEIDGLEVGDHGALRFSMAARSLPAGEYRVLLFARSSETVSGEPKEAPLAVYELRVAERDDRAP